MGNSYSNHNYNNNNNTHNSDCIICWENVEDIDKVTCIRCNISLHAFCEETDRSINTRQYCRCPHCQQVGTLGVWKIV